MRPPWTWRRAPMVLPKEPAGASAADPPCVVHLVHRMYCPQALREFAAALRAHPPGCEHELVLLVKGFASPAQAGPYLEEVADLAPRLVFVPDHGFDTGSYLYAAAQLRRHRYCFLKSQCRPLVDGWLRKLDTALARPGVGQVGATGAWMSSHSWMLYELGLPSAYRRLLPPRREVDEILARFHLDEGAIEPPPPDRSVRARLKRLPDALEQLFGFDHFPNPHLRTTAFMLTHAVLRELCLFEVRNKNDTFALESGRDSLTRQLRRMGLSSLVVDRTGAVYEPDQWHRSRTYLQGDQEGLMVAENQTRRYTVGDFDRRRVLAALAWGSRADPRPVAIPAPAPRTTA
jgi:hypothetical protein